MTARAPIDPRVALAAERTLLAWIRTGLAMMGFGFVVARFGLFLRELAAVERPLPGSSPHVSLWMGTSLVILGVVTNLVAGARHVRLLRRLARGDGAAAVSYLGVGLAVALACIGVGMAAYLVLFTAGA